MHARALSNLILAIFALWTAFGPLASAAIAEPSAGVAAIETTAVPEDESEASVKDAIASAVKAAFRGALAMGLPWVQIAGAYVRPGYVGVKVLATAQPPDRSEGNAESGDTPEETPAPRPEQIQKYAL